MTAKLFSELGLSPEVLKAVDKLGFEQASPIQAESIPVLLSGRDVVGQSSTGSGKTAAFGIPAIEKVDPAIKAVQILVLCPTRELAVQVSEEIHKLASFKRGIHCLPIYGGQSYERQFMGLKAGAQIVIGTPGRVMDHMKRGTLRLDAVKMAILDEADVMLNMGFREDIELILTDVPKERQTVFFSATMPPAIRELINKFSREPQTVKIEQKAMTVPTVEQFYYEVDRRFKIEALTRIIDLHDYKLGIIFCNTKRMVDDLVDHLNAQGYSADRLHGDMTQHMRDRVMNKFRKSGLEFLVATDVAARGIDVDNVEVVFNYDLPYDVEDYVHRIGRTGRAGRAGKAISFTSYREFFQIRNIERYTNQRIQRGVVPSENQVLEAKDEQFVGRVSELLASGDFPKSDALVERLLSAGQSSADLASVLIHLLRGAGDAPSKSEVAAAAAKASAPKSFTPRQASAGATEGATSEAAPTEAGAAEPRPERPAPPARPAYQPRPDSRPSYDSRPPRPGYDSRPPRQGYDERPRYPDRQEYRREDPRGGQYGDKYGGQGQFGGPRGDRRAGPGDDRRPSYPQRPERPGYPSQGDRPSYPPQGGRPSYPQRGERADYPPQGQRAPYPQRDDREGYQPRAPRERKPAYSATPYDEAPPLEPKSKTGAPLPVKKFPAMSSSIKPLPASAPKAPAAPAEKTYSDAEILGAIKEPAAAGGEGAPVGKKPKASRATPPTHTRLWMSVGESQGVSPIDVVNSVSGETGLPGKVVGMVDVREKHLFADVLAEHANAVISKLNRAEIKGHKVKVKLA